MEPNEILKKAWAAVQASGVPESMQDTAFKEAVAILRGEDGGSGADAGSSGGRTPAGKKKTSPKPQRRKSEAAIKTSVEIPDEATFFTELAKESGASETDLRDILQLSA